MAKKTQTINVSYKNTIVTIGPFPSDGANLTIPEELAEFCITGELGRKMGEFARAKVRDDEGNEHAASDSMQAERLQSINGSSVETFEEFWKLLGRTGARRSALLDRFIDNEREQGAESYNAVFAMAGMEPPVAFADLSDEEREKWFVARGTDAYSKHQAAKSKPESN